MGEDQSDDRRVQRRQDVGCLIPTDLGRIRSHRHIPASMQPRFHAPFAPDLRQQPGGAATSGGWLVIPEGTSVLVFPVLRSVCR